MNDNKPVLSRRNFLMNAIAAAGVLTLADRLALAEQMASGKALTINDIHSAGLPPGIIRMSSNENPLGPSPKAMEAVEKYKWNSNRYSWYEQDEKGIPKSLSTRTTLNDALAKANGITLPAPYKSESGYDRQDNPFLVTSGSGRILDLLSLTYLVPDGGEIIEAEYGYGDFIEKAEDLAEEGFATRAIKIPMTKDHGHDLEAMLKAVTPETRLMVITNPNNPTGTLISYEALEQFVNAVPKHVVVVIDEAYIHFVTDPNYKPAVSLALSNDNVVVVRTFSKVYGIKGLGLGYAITSQTIKDRLSLYNTNSASAVASMAGAAALEDFDHVEAVRQTVTESKALMYKSFEKMGLEYIPSEGCFVMVNINRDAEQIKDAMANRRRVNVSTRNLRSLETWLRISAGTKEETEVFLSTLELMLSRQRL